MWYFYLVFDKFDLNVVVQPEFFQGKGGLLKQRRFDKLDVKKGPTENFFWVLSFS